MEEEAALAVTGLRLGFSLCADYSYASGRCGVAERRHLDVIRAATVQAREALAYMVGD